MVVPAAAIGIICGICAIIFTLINLKVQFLAALCSTALSRGLRHALMTHVWFSTHYVQVARARQEFFKGRPAK